MNVLVKLKAFAYRAGLVTHAAGWLWCLNDYSVGGLEGAEAGYAAEVLHSSFTVHSSHDEVLRL